MRFTVSGSIIKYEPKYKNCTVDFNGTWIPLFVPDGLANDIRLDVVCRIDFCLKCKFSKGQKPYVYLVLKGVQYE